MARVGCRVLPEWVSGYGGPLGGWVEGHRGQVGRKEEYIEVNK